MSDSAISNSVLSPTEEAPVGIHRAYRAPAAELLGNAPRPHSRLGLASTWLGGGGLVCLASAFAYAYFIGSRRSVVATNEAIVAALVLLTGFAALLLGLALGVAALCRPDRRKLFGVAGLAMNGLPLAAAAAMIWLNARS